MKKLLAIILALSLCLGLTACGSSDLDLVSYTHDDLTIGIPQDFIDLSGEEFAEGLSFIYGLDPIAVNGLKESKSTFEAYGLQLDLETYGTFLTKSNNVNSTLVQTDGIWNFSYESGEFTYVVTLWETEEAFWTVQAYCPTADYSKVKDDIWEILSSVTV